MAETDYSSLRAAVDRILGLPPGGNAPTISDAATAGTGGGGVQLPETTTSVTNSPVLYDPNAESKAQIAAMQAETAALQAGTGGVGGAPASTTPAVSTWAGQPQNALIQRDPVTGAYRAKGWDEDVKGFIEVTPQSLQQNAALRRTMEWGMGPTAYGSNPAYNQYSNEVKNLFGQAGVSTAGNFTGYTRPVGGAAAPAVAKTASGMPINPGPRAPWQASAQYWKDLEAYRAAQGQ